MSDWDILDDSDGGNGVEEDVEYVGVEEVDDVVQEPTGPRRMVRRVAPSAQPTPQPPQQRLPNGQVMYEVPRQGRGNGAVGAASRDDEDLVSYVNMPHGKQLGLTAEAVKRMGEAPMTRINGQAAQRLEPGTYVMYGPTRAGMMGMGTNGEVDYDRMARTGEAAPGSGGAYRRSVPAMGTNGDSAPAQSQGGGGSSVGWLGDMFGALANLGTGIATAVARGRVSEREAATERLRIAAEQEAAASAREVAFREAQLEHAERMARIEAGSEELEALQRQAEEAARLREELSQQPAGAPVGAPSGPGIGTFLVLGVLGLGLVGGAVWFFGFRKKDDEDEE